MKLECEKADSGDFAFVGAVEILSLRLRLGLLLEGISFRPTRDSQNVTLAITIITPKETQSTGFEPVRAEPNRFLVYRLNHSATTAPKTSIVVERLDPNNSKA